jgi:hypothetical protein
MQGASAQQATFTSSVSRNKVAVGEQFQLSFTLNQAGGSFRPPDLSEFHVLSGPSTSTSVQFINGVMSQSYTYYFVLAGKKEGRFTIGSASVVANGKKLESKPLNVEVVKGAAAQKSNPRDPSNGYPQDISSNVFLKASVSRTKVFVGEALKVSFKVYTRISLVNVTSQKLPSFDGFWSEEIPDKSKNIQLYEEVMDGIVYNVGDLGSYLLIPQRAGTLEIGPMEMDWVVRVQGRSRSNSLFEQFFGGGYQDMKISLATKKLSVQVEPLPSAGKPASFNGAVGDFQISSRLNRHSLKKNESANLLITLNGNGNLKFIEPPVPLLADGLESYDPKVTQKLNISSDGISGQKTFDYLIIPRRGGEFLIPAQEFSYFNPAERKYKTIRLPEMKISAEGGDDDQARVLNESNPKSEVRQLGKDLAFIHTTERSFDGSFRFFNTPFYWLLLLAFPACAISYRFYFSRQLAERADVVGWRKKTASRHASERFRMAEKLASSGSTEFYTELEKGLSEYFSDRFDIPKASFSSSALSDKMKLFGVHESLQTEISVLFAKIQMARYAPSEGASSQVSDLQLARTIIQKLEEIQS